MTYSAWWCMANPICLCRFPFYLMGPSVSLAPTLTVVDRTPLQVARQLETILSDVVKAPVVSVSVTPNQGAYVVVLGEVQRPGIYPITGEEVSLLEAIGLAGGTSVAADLSAVEVFASGGISEATKAPIGAEGILFAGEAAVNPTLASGSIVYVPPMVGGDQMIVLGEVRSPGAYPVEPGQEVRILLELIARAGGNNP